jgi:hypothetical protein
MIHGPIGQSRDKLSAERRGLAEVIRTEFAERLVATEEENRRMKVEVAEARARLRLEVERVSREKEAELAEVHQRWGGGGAGSHPPFRCCSSLTLSQAELS